MEEFILTENEFGEEILRFTKKNSRFKAIFAAHKNLWENLPPNIQKLALKEMGLKIEQVQIITRIKRKKYKLANFL
jgi:hypothetical protein